VKYLPDHKAVQNPKFHGHAKISAKVPGTPPVFRFLTPSALEAEAVSNSFAFHSWKWFDTALI